MIGELSKYEKVMAQPSTAVELRVAHNLGVAPKIILLHAEFEPLEAACVTDGVFSTVLGACHIVSLTADANYAYNVMVGSTGTTNATAYLNTDSVVIYRQSSARVFNRNAVYTVELYA